MASIGPALPSTGLAIPSTGLAIPSTVPARHGPWISTCLIHMAPGDNMCHRYQHGHQKHGPRCGLLQQPDPDVTMTLSGSTGHLHRPVPHHLHFFIPSSLHSPWAIPILFLSHFSTIYLFTVMAPKGLWVSFTHQAAVLYFSDKDIFFWHYVFSLFQLGKPWNLDCCGFCCCLDWVLLWNSGWSDTLHVQACLTFIILLSQSPMYWDYRPEVASSDGSLESRSG